jgi:hypothetical protein
VAFSRSLCGGAVIKRIRDREKSVETEQALAERSGGHGEICMKRYG